MKKQKAVINAEERLILDIEQQKIRAAEADPDSLKSMGEGTTLNRTDPEEKIAISLPSLAPKAPAPLMKRASIFEEEEEEEKPTPKAAPTLPNTSM